MGIDEAFNEVTAKAVEAATSNQSETPKESLAPSTAPSNSEILDLDKVEKFKFEGREMTREEAKNSWLRQQDYTRKTQELAKERESYKESQTDKQFSENLYADLKNVRDNPELADKFRQVYPEKYHSYLDILEAKQQEASAPVKLQADPEMYGIKKELAEVKGYFQEQRVQAAEAQIDAIISKLSPKYPLADEETALVRARAANENGVKLTAESWEDIYKGIHEKNLARYKEHYEKQVKEQQTANKNGKDTGKGGGIPGSAPKKLSWDDADKSAFAAMSGRNN